MALLEVSDLVVGYDAFPVLHGISFQVEEGECCVLLGLNGAGKTTTVSSVAGMLKPRSGRISFAGKELRGGSPSSRVAGGISLSPEGRRVFPRMTVKQNLRLGAWTRRREAKTVKRQLDLVLDYFPRLAEREGQLAGTLSGGEQQMLALARAVGLATTLLMADELSLGLAPILVQTIAETIRRLHEEEGRTILLVEQYATQALRLADFVYILNRGHLAWAGEPDELRASKVLVESYLGES